MGLLLYRAQPLTVWLQLNARVWSPAVVEGVMAPEQETGKLLTPADCVAPVLFLPPPPDPHALPL